MTSEEMKERLSKRPNPHNLYAFNEEQVKELINDLEVLEILKGIIEVVENLFTKYTIGPRYYIKLRENVFLNDETKQIIKEWLEK
jgi:hypothetical protein